MAGARGSKRKFSLGSGRPRREFVTHLIDAKDFGLAPRRQELSLMRNCLSWSH